MKIRHRYRDLLDSSYSNKISTCDWDLYDEVDNCKIFHDKGDTNKKLAVKTVYGLYAKEIAYHFWNIDEPTKLEWDQSVQSMKVLEILSPNCAIIHLKMKRIWPANARDCVLCTELSQIGDYEWVVTNISVDHPLAKVNESDYTRMNCRIHMVVKEELIDGKKGRTRDNIISTINYNADVDVGSWISNNIISSMCHKTWINTLDDLCNTIKNHK